jgi:hypothetical protein
MPGFLDPTTGQWVEVAPQALSPQTLAMTMPAPPPQMVPMAMPPQGPTPTPVPTIPPSPGPAPTMLPPPGGTPTPMPTSTPVTPMAPTPLAPAVVAGLKGEDPKDAFSVAKTSTVQSPKPAGPGDFGFGKALNQQKDAAKQSADITTAEQMGMSDLYAEQAKVAAEREENQIKIREAYDEPFIKTEQALSESLEEQSKAIDPRRYWKNRNGFEKVGAALSIMAGSIGDALMQIGGIRGPGNTALDIIMKSVQDDIDAQKADKTTAAQKSSSMFNTFQMYRAKLGDDLAAEHATYIDKIEGIKSRAMSLAASASSKQAQAQWANVIGVLDEKKAERAFELHKYNTELALTMAKLAEKSGSNPQLKQMMSAEKELDDLWRKKGMKGPDVLPFGEDKTYEGAADQWAMNYLKASGTRISKEAMKSVKKAFFPTATTINSDVLASFRSRRKNAMQSLLKSEPTNEEPGIEEVDE